MKKNSDTVSMSSKKEEEAIEKDEVKVEVEPKKVVEKSRKKEERPKPTQIPVFRNMRDMARNPITGVGLEADIDRPRKNQCKKG